MSYFIGVDQSIRATGLVVLDHGGKVEDARLLTPLRGVNRLQWFRDTLTSILRERAPELIGMEGYAFANFPQASVWEIGGILKLIMADLELSYVVVNPSHVKKYASGKGNIKKNLVLKEVYKKWHEDFNDDNLADAYVMARIVHDLQTESFDKVLKYEADVLKKQTIIRPSTIIC